MIAWKLERNLTRSEKKSRKRVWCRMQYIYKLILQADKFNESSAHFCVLATIHFRFDESRACVHALCVCMLIIVQANLSFLLSFLFSCITIY